jgi:hypothetical protein
VLLRAFVPLITAAALINGWVNTTLPSWMHVNPAVTPALCAVIFAALIAIIILQISNLVGGRIDRAEAARNLAQAELLALNAHLETKVQERTRTGGGRSGRITDADQSRARSHSQAS